MLPVPQPVPRPTRWIRTGGLVTCGMTRVLAAIFPRAYPPVLVGWTGAVLIVTSLYFVVFVVTEHHILKGDALVWAACNSFPHVLLAVPLVDRVGPKLGRLRLWGAVALAVSAALAYAALAYSATIFLLALTSRIEADGLWVQFFQGPAVVWQSFQALAYAALALTVGLLLEARRDVAMLRSVKPSEPVARNWLVRTSDGIVPIDPRELIRIEADGDYVRIILPQRTLMSRIELGECARRLAGLPFMRIHRSHMVNSDAIVRAEPAGNGRLLIQLRNGDQVTTSREGARLVREASL